MSVPVTYISRHMNIVKKCIFTVSESFHIQDKHSLNVLSQLTAGISRRFFSSDRSTLTCMKTKIYSKDSSFLCSQILKNPCLFKLNKPCQINFTNGKNIMLPNMRNRHFCISNSLNRNGICNKWLPIVSIEVSRRQLDSAFKPRYCFAKHNKISYDTQHAKVMERKKIYGGGKENILTIPNLLTISRIVATPFLGYMVLHEHFDWSLGIFAYAGITDLLDGYIARNFSNQNSALGTALDPLADKLLVIVLTLTLTNVDLIPMPLTALIIIRDVALIASVFYIRYISLPPPKTMSRYFDVTLATAKLYPSMLSKINTALQLSLVAFTLAAPVFHYVDHPLLQALWCATGATTFMSGLSYMISWRKNFRVLKAEKSSQVTKM